MKKIKFCGLLENQNLPLARYIQKKGSALPLSCDAGWDELNIVSAKDIDEVKKLKDSSSVYMTYSNLLADVFHQYGMAIGVAGNKKEIISTMLAHVLNTLGFSPCLIGKENLLYNDGEICIAEADEEGIKELFSYIGVISDIGDDTLKTTNDYSIFADHIAEALVFDYDCPIASKYKHHKKNFSYSVKSNKANVFAYNIQAKDGETTYSIEAKRFKLMHEDVGLVSCVLAVICVCQVLGLDKFDVAKTLEQYDVNFKYN